MTQISERSFLSTSEDKARCHWCNLKNPLYVRYHDEEWGVPVHHDAKLFEMLLLECFQAGLSWECVLNKREAFSIAFDGFDAKRIACYDEKKLACLQQDSSIIRNKLKLKATISNAQAFLRIQQEFGTFDAYIQQFTHGEVMYDYQSTTSPLSDALSLDLKKRGMKFVGSTIVYSFLQAIGVINSHEPQCHLHIKP